MQPSTHPRRSNSSFDAALLLLLIPLGLALAGRGLDSSSSELVLVGASASVIACASIALVSRIRYRHLREPEAAYEAGAFLLAGMIAAIAVVRTALHTPASSGDGEVTGVTVDAALILGRATVGWLLVQGAVWSWRHRPLRRPAASALVLLPTAALTTAVALGPIWEPVAASRASATFVGAFVGLQFVTAILFLVAALMYRRLYRRSRRIAHAFFAVGLLVWASGELHAAIFHTLGGSLLAVDETLRLGAYALLLCGGLVQVSEDLRADRRAHRKLKAFRGSELSARVDDQERVAREIHDGIAQDLAAAKLAFAQLRGSLPQRLAETHCDRVDRALDDALVSARTALVSIRDDGRTTPPVATLLEYRAEKFRQRFGVPVAVHASHVTALDPVVTREIGMIASEALHNAGQHARASRVNVVLDIEDGVVRLEIADDGRGFAGNDREGHLGLRGMRERAEVIGGHLDVRSAPGVGTRIVLLVPQAETPVVVAEGDASRVLTRGPWQPLGERRGGPERA